MASTQTYIATPKSPCAQISTANTNRDGTGTIGTVHTAGSSGARIDSLAAIATSTTTAGMLRFFIDISSTIRLLCEVPVQAVTPSGTVSAWSAVLNSSTHPGVFPLVLQSGAILKASTNNAETFNVHVTTGGDF